MKLNKALLKRIIKKIFLALAELEKILREKTGGSGFGFRMIRSPANPKKLTLVLDKEKEGDRVIKKGKTRILLVSPEIATDLEGVVLDYIEGSGLKIIRKG